MMLPLPLLLLLLLVICPYDGGTGVNRLCNRRCTPINGRYIPNHLDTLCVRFRPNAGKYSLDHR